MIDMSIWYTSHDALVADDVAAWRTSLETDETFIFHAEIPDEHERLQMMKPVGFIGSSDRCVLIWNVEQVGKNDLLDFLDQLDHVPGITFHVGFVTDSNLAKEIYEYEPEEFDYAVADDKNPIVWADNYLQQWCNARLTDDAYEHLQMVAMSDTALVAEVVSNIYRFIGGQAEEDSEEREITLADVDNALTRLGEAAFFDLTNAIDSGDVSLATNLSMRVKPDSIHGILSMQRRKMSVAAMRDSGISIEEVMDTFRDRVAEDKEIEAKRAKLIAQGKMDEDSDLDDSHHVVKYKVSEKMAKYLFNNLPRYTEQEAHTIWNMIAKTDHDAKSGRLSGTTVLEFATTIALVNTAAKKRSKKRARRF